jgi:hypothetical protein
MDFAKMKEMPGDLQLLIDGNVPSVSTQIIVMNNRE